MTTVVMVSGSWPPSACGVGDYAELLCRNLEAAGIDVRRYGHAHLSRWYSSSVMDELAASNCDVIHVQYPTTGYGSSFVPGAIAQCVRGKPVVATLHEYSLFSFYRKPWFTPFARFCATRIFTTGFERALFAERFPQRNGFDTIIEAASNTPVGAPANRAENKVVYVGLIAPNKGIEDFIEFCEIARANDLDVAADLIGAVPPQNHTYTNSVIARARGAGINVECNLPTEQVADRLAQATFAYLPFPEGASAKRGALAAAMINGLAIITRYGALTPEWLRTVTVGVASPEEACQAVLRLTRDAPARRELVRRTALAAKRFSWDTVTARHVELYERLLGLSDEMPGLLARA
jgi:glycosyltransferase involved in cell wall biosynthesis